jgi:hypothetical protein
MSPRGQVFACSIKAKAGADASGHGSTPGARAGRPRSDPPKLGTTGHNRRRCFVSVTLPCFYVDRIVQEGDTRMNDVTGKITSEQALLIVQRLCRKGGDIRDAVVAEAISLLSEFSLDEIADEVFDALDLIDIQDCRDLAGASHDGSYTSPVEAAVDVIEEELQPFFDQVERYHDLGMIEQEAAYCKGVLLGIYRFEQDSQAEIKELAEDIPAECAGSLLDEWRKRNPDKAGVAAVEGFVRERCPKWAGWAGEE